MRRSVEVVPPTVLTGPVPEGTNADYSVYPPRLLLPGEAVRWSSDMHHVCPRCWDVFTLRDHTVDVDKEGQVTVTPSVACPLCGLHTYIRDGAHTEVLEEHGRPAEDWEQSREERVSFVRGYRPTATRLVIETHYPNLSSGQ